MGEKGLGVLHTKLDGVLKIRPPFQHQDLRGTNLETWNARLYREAGFPEFVQDSITFSIRDVLRGIHGDSKTTKLLSCLDGSIYVVVVNNDPESQQYRKWERFHLVRGGYQLLVPPKFGNAHLVLSDYAIFAYKLSSYTDTKSQFTLKWNDPNLGIQWPIDNPLLSDRDRGDW